MEIQLRRKNREPPAGRARALRPSRHSGQREAGRARQVGPAVQRARDHRFRCKIRQGAGQADRRSRARRVRLLLPAMQQGRNAGVSNSLAVRGGSTSLLCNLRIVTDSPGVRTDPCVGSLALCQAHLGRAGCRPRPAGARKRRCFVARHDWLFGRPACGLHHLGQRKAAHRSRP